jgi:hypothetical protein
MEVNGMSPRDLLRLQRLTLLIMHSTPRKFVYIIMHFGFFNLLSGVVEHAEVGGHRPSEGLRSGHARGRGSPRPSLTGKTAHALNQHMRSQPQDKMPQSVAHPALQET